MTEYNQYFQSSDYQHSRPPKPKFPWFRIIIIALIAGIIGALIVLGVNRLMNGDDSNSGGSQVQQATNDKGGNVLDGKCDKYKSVNAMIKDVSPAIVGVINMQKVTSFDDLLQGKSTKAQEAGIGSGVIYQINNNSSYIVTNNHVIDGASQIKVQLHNGKQVEAKLVGTDAVSDIAVLKIDSQKGIKAMKFANSSKVQTGDSVFA
ncbi:serine protease, partial [Staphylococcus hominis]